MKLFYQYIQGEKQGDVVTLDHIDDIDPDNIIAVFSNGDKCRMDLIANINDFTAYDQHKIMASVESEKNIWKFDTKKPQVKQLRDANGNNHECLDPYYFDNQGNPIQHESGFKSVVVKHPRYSAKENIVIPDEYYLSKKPAEDDFDAVLDTPVVQNPTPIIQHENIVPKQSIQINTDVRIVGNLLLDLDDPDLKLGNLICYYKKEITDFGNLKDFLIDYLNDDSDDLENTIENVIATNPVKPEVKSENKRSFDTINLLLNDCKTVDTEIDLGLGINLPNKSFINYFKDNYSDDWTNDLIDEIVNRIDPEVIKKSLVYGLKSYYGLVGDSGDYTE